jgi:hypothetical protein
MPATQDTSNSIKRQKRSVGFENRQTDSSKGDRFLQRETRLVSAIMVFSKSLAKGAYKEMSGRGESDHKSLN